MKLDIARQRLNTPAKPTNQARRPVVLRLEACPPRGQENAARFRSRIEFLCRMMTDRTSRLTFAITSVFAASLIFYFAIAAALAAPAEPSPPPVTPPPKQNLLLSSSYPHRR